MAKPSERLPKELQRLIPKTVEKGIYYRLYKLKDGSQSLKWWVKVWKDGQPIYQSTDSSTYGDAVELKQRLIAEMVSGQRSGGAPERVRINELLNDWLDENTSASEETKRIYRYSVEANIRPAFGSLKPVQLTTERLAEYRKQRVKKLMERRRSADDDGEAKAKKAAHVTVNREFAYLRASLLHASKKTPPKVLRVPSFPMAKEDNARQGFLEASVYEKLRDAFLDTGVQLLFIVAYNIGVRSKELRLIEWDQVDFRDGIISILRTKNGEARAVPIFSGDMFDYLKAAKATRDRLYPQSKWVFSRTGEPIKDFREEWENSCKRAGCSGLLFHDLRRTAVRNMVRIHGLDRTIAKKISGHKTDSMFDRYNIIDVEDIKAAKRHVDSRRANLQVASDSGLAARIAGLPSEKRNLLESLLAQLGS